MAQVKTTVKKESMKERMRAKGYLSAPEVAQRLGRHQTTIYDLIKAGELKGLFIGKRWFVELASVMKYLGPEAAKLLDVTAKA